MPPELPTIAKPFWIRTTETVPVAAALSPVHDALSCHNSSGQVFFLYGVEGGECTAAISEEEVGEMEGQGESSFS